MTMSYFDKLKRRLKAFSVLDQLERQDRAKFEEIFNRSIEDMCILFGMAPSGVLSAHIPSYPKPNYLKDSLGIDAFGMSFDVEVEQYPIFWNRLKQGREEVKPWHFQREVAGAKLHTLINPRSVRCGRDIRLVTNDLDVIHLAASKDFMPPPPWLVWYEAGPSLGMFNQAEPEYWYMTTWQPFWSSLTVEEQTAYLREKRKLTRPYMSEDDWQSWVTLVRLADERTSQTGWED